MEKGGSAISDFITFSWVIFAGVAVGLVFDFYRSFRRWRGWGRVLTFMGDLLFSAAAMAILFYFFKQANELAFRFYIIWGSMLGLALYLKVLSRFFLRFYFGLYKMINYLTGLVYRGLMIPVRGLILIMEPPYALLKWFSLLFFRIGEYLLSGISLTLKKKLRSLWENLIPPKINS